MADFPGGAALVSVFCGIGLAIITYEALKGLRSFARGHPNTRIWLSPIVGLVIGVFLGLFLYGMTYAFVAGLMMADLMSDLWHPAVPYVLVIELGLVAAIAALVMRYMDAE